MTSLAIFLIYVGSLSLLCLLAAGIGLVAEQMGWL